jgi:hypothetical protein
MKIVTSLSIDSPEEEKIRVGIMLAGVSPLHTIAIFAIVLLLIFF